MPDHDAANVRPPALQVALPAVQDFDELAVVEEQQQAVDGLRRGDAPKVRMFSEDLLGLANGRLQSFRPGGRARRSPSSAA